MVGSDIGDINSPTHAGSRSTRVDPKLFGKPSDFLGRQTRMEALRVGIS